MTTPLNLLLQGRTDDKCTTKWWACRQRTRGWEVEVSGEEKCFWAEQSLWERRKERGRESYGCPAGVPGRGAV